VKFIKEWWKVAACLLLLATLEALLQYFLGSPELWITMQLFNIVVGVCLALNKDSYTDTWR